MLLLLLLLVFVLSAVYFRYADVHRSQRFNDARHQLELLYQKSSSLPD